MPRLVSTSARMSSCDDRQPYRHPSHLGRQSQGDDRGTRSSSTDLIQDLSSAQNALIFHVSRSTALRETMMINDGVNPLAEVALALAAGFLQPDDPHAVRHGQRAQGRCHRRQPRHHGNGCRARDPPPDNEERHLVIFTDGGFFDEDLNRLDPLQLIRRNLSFWRYHSRCRFHARRFSAPISRPHDRNRRTDPRLGGTDRRHGTRGGPMKRSRQEPC